jgi:eukaryotic-like serine/threonine-protein kinase
MLSPGMKLGPYEIEAPLGAGGMGEVYRARDTRLDRRVAVKVLSAKLASHPAAKQRFSREARAISSLQHPHICVLHDIGTDSGIDFLVMEFLEGETLAQRLELGPLELPCLLKIACEVVDALEVAHNHDIIHRDLKPANLFLTSLGQTKILDFGVVTSKSSEETLDPDQMLTDPGHAVGTISYMSPEQARGESLDNRSDLFALGVVLYEMSTGRRAFPGGTAAIIIDGILNREPVHPSSINPSVPRSLEAIILRCLEKHPGDRYSSAVEILCDLRSVSPSSRIHPIEPMKPAGRKIPSIAVLPFANLSSDPDNQYFSDGLSEDLISALAKLPELHVASRTSAFRFRGREDDICEIGHQLNVQAVLEGSVRRSGKRLRINAQLVNIADGFHLWSERYDREAADIFDIQDEITTAIVETLEPTLAGRARPATRRHSNNIQAYELYLRGRSFWEQRMESTMRSAIECFRAAVGLDPAYALAHAGLADCYAILSIWGYLRHADGRVKARSAIENAIRSDSSLPEVYFSQGLFECAFSPLGGHAENYFRMALQIEPRNSTVQVFVALNFAVLGRVEEAVASAARAVQLDPLSAPVHGAAGLAMHACRRFDQAIAYANRALELQQNLVTGLWALTLSLCGSRRYSECIEVALRLASISRRAPVFLAPLGLAYARAHQPDKALEILQELHIRGGTEFVNACSQLTVQLGLKNRDAALKNFWEYYDSGGRGWEVQVALAPLFPKLRDDPEVQEIYRKMEESGSVHLSPNEPTLT